MDHLKQILRGNEISCGYRVGYLSNVFSGPVYKVAERDYGIQRPMFATLFCIAHLDGLTAAHVCGMTGIAKNTISRAVTRLEKKGLVRRHPNPDDSRSSILQMTATGKRTYKAILALLRARERALLGPLAAAERKQLLALFDKLIIRDDGWPKAY